MLPRCPFKTKCIAAARKEAEERNTGHQRTKEEVEEDVCTSVVDVSRRLIQASLGVDLVRENRWRAKGENYKYQFLEEQVVPNGDQLQIEKEADVITLTGLSLKVGKSTIVGTLEVHRNGIIYKSHDFHVPFLHFLYSNVKKVFLRVEDEKMAYSLLHFHFHEPITVGAEKKRNVQFRLMPDKMVEELKSFLQKVTDKWCQLPVFRSCFPFAGAELHKRDEFQGNLPSKAPTVFALNCFTLVGLLDEPFVVVNLIDVEIVNLGKPMPSTGVAQMIVVYKDLKCDPVIINSIPLALLDLIKGYLTSAHVKYFENHFGSLDWDSVLKERAESPKEFYRDGGWSALNLEEHETLQYYHHYFNIPEENYFDNPELIYESEDDYGSEYDNEPEVNWES